MTEMIVIVCIAQNNVIGKNNDIPWRIKEDFLHFKNQTMGYPCIMGDKTYNSLPDNARPLPGRENIVCTWDEHFNVEGTTIFRDFFEAVNYCKKKGVEKAFITGGATIYKLGMKVADTFMLTRINKDYEGDVTFPEIYWKEWKLINQEDHQSVDTLSGQSLSFSFLTYKRQKND